MTTRSGQPAPHWLLERRAASALAATTSWMAPGVHRFDVPKANLAVFAPELGADTPVLLYVHGGGFRNGSVQTYAAYASRLAARLRVRVALVQYRLAPEHPFPAALEDVTTAYEWAVQTLADPRQTVVAGESAGGGLIAALLLEIPSRGWGLPAGAAVFSPWVDMTCSATSYAANAATEKLFPHAAAVEAASMYLAGTDPRTELASPVFATWPAAHPPMLIRASESEVLRDDAITMARNAAAAGVDVDLRLYPGQPHAWPVTEPESAATDELLSELNAFIDRVVPARAGNGARV